MDRVSWWGEPACGNAGRDTRWGRGRGPPEIGGERGAQVIAQVVLGSEHGPMPVGAGAARKAAPLLAHQHE